MTAPTLPYGFPALTDPYEEAQHAGIDHLLRIAAEQKAACEAGRGHAGKPPAAA